MCLATPARDQNHAVPLPEEALYVTVPVLFLQPSGGTSSAGQVAMMRRGMALRSSSPFQRGSGLEAPSPVALAQEKQRQEMWEKTGVVSLRDQGLQVCSSPHPFYRSGWPKDPWFVALSEEETRRLSDVGEDWWKEGTQGPLTGAPWCQCCALCRLLGKCRVWSMLRLMAGCQTCSPVSILCFMVGCQDMLICVDTEL